jgi:hypothetical protein
MSENTLNAALKRMGYEDRLTGHGIRATISTALNELGYPKVWVDSQLSHADPNRISATYNHAEYVEQRRVMMQDWADRLDLFEQNQVQVASMHLTIHLQGLPTIAGQQTTPLPTLGQHAPILLVAPTEQSLPAVAPATQRLSAVEMPEYAQPKLSELQRERLKLLEICEGPGNVLLVVLDYPEVTEVFSAFGERGVPAETVADRAAREARLFRDSGVPVGEHLADQLLLPMALCGRGSFTTHVLSSHLRTNCRVIEEFLPVRFACEEIERQARVSLTPA